MSFLVEQVIRYMPASQLTWFRGPNARRHLPTIFQQRRDRSRCHAVPMLGPIEVLTAVAASAPSAGDQRRPLTFLSHMTVDRTPTLRPPWLLQLDVRNPYRSRLLSLCRDRLLFYRIRE